MSEKKFYDWHSQDSRIKGPMETANSVVAQYGTGGGNTPIVVHKAICIQGSIIGRADHNGPQGSGINEDVSFTLNTIDRHAVAYNEDLRSYNNISTFEEQSFSRFQHSHVSATLKAAGGGVTYGSEALIASREPHYIVRRLMPLECSRLQGFPDGWGGIETLPADISDDTAAFWRQVYLTDCTIKNKKPRNSILAQKEKLAIWHNKLHTDSAEYKMWGNGMALPNAYFVVQRALNQICQEEHRQIDTLKLGSLFDGSGTMPLSATMCGAQAVWASEVEPYPIAVTKTHLPCMRHLGNITSINGAEIEPVDIITFGSPCQDLSIAGRREGLSGSRSSLFLEAIRVAKEMLQATNGKYPRFLIWENVQGALSSNKGEDFGTVLNALLHLSRANEFIRSSGKWKPYGGYGAVAYRLVNAQYWGVPQRRRRIYAIADTRGESADEVLFERTGDGWHFDPCIPQGQAIAGLTNNCYQWYERLVGAN